MTRRKFDSFAISVVRKGWKLGFEVLKLRKFFFKTKATRLILNYLKFTGIKDFSCSKTAIHSRPQNPSINSIKICRSTDFGHELEYVWAIVPNRLFYSFMALESIYLLHIVSISTKTNILRL